MSEPRRRGRPPKPAFEYQRPSIATSIPDATHSSEISLPPALKTDEERFLNINQAAAVLQIHPATLQRLIADKKCTVPYGTVGSSVRFSAQQLISWGARQMNGVDAEGDTE